MKDGFSALPPEVLDVGNLGSEIPGLDSAVHNDEVPSSMRILLIMEKGEASFNVSLVTRGGITLEHVNDRSDCTAKPRPLGLNPKPIARNTYEERNCGETLNPPFALNLEL
ncbi:unnamed protein product [Camellia sinensis]